MTACTAVSESSAVAAGVDNPPLRALRDGVDGPNGVYVTNANGGVTSLSYVSSNFWVDVLFTTP